MDERCSTDSILYDALLCSEIILLCVSSFLTVISFSLFLGHMPKKIFQLFTN